MMKKITLIMSLLFGLSLNAQLFWFDDISDDLSTDYTMIDEDARSINPFYTDQGVFGDGSWELVNFGSPLGVAYYSCSSFSGADSCLATNDYMILPVFDFTTAAAPEITLSAGSMQGAGEVQVLVTNSIAGAAPVAADFTSPAVGTITLTGAYQEQTFSLASVANSATVYVAIVNTSVECAGLIAVKDIKVRNQGANGLTVAGSSIVDEDIVHSDLAYNYSIMDCGAGSVAITADYLNEGTAAFTDTAYFACVYGNSLGNVIIEDTVDFMTSPLAAGATYVHTFSQNVDYSLVDVSVFTVYAIVENDFDSTNNEFGHIVAAPNTHDLATGQYVNSFELDFADGEILANTLSTVAENNGTMTEWTLQDYSVYSNAADFLTDGDYLMEHAYTGDHSSYPGSDNWVFTPCITFDNTKAYKVTFDYNTFSGNAAPHNMNFMLTSATNSGSVVETVLSGETLDAEILTNFSKGFAVANSGDYHFAIQDQSASGFFLMMDLLVIEELPAPTMPSVSSSWEPCTVTATLTFAYDPSNTYTVDWNDGSAVETITSGNPTHVYATSTTAYNPVVTVTSIAGSDNGTTVVNATPLPTPDATFAYIQNGLDDVSIDFSADQVVSCYTYDWDFGDNSAHEAGTTATHTYTAAGTYTVTLFIQDPITSDFSSISRDVVIEIEDGDAINEINFVDGINVFPNPATDVLNINFELNSIQNVEVTFHSIDGKVISSTEDNTAAVNEVINTSKLAAGIYILDVTTDAGKFTTNVIVK